MCCRRSFFLVAEVRKQLKMAGVQERCKEASMHMGFYRCCPARAAQLTGGLEDAVAPQHVQPASYPAPCAIRWMDGLDGH